MPDKRRHRGKHPSDDKIFSVNELKKIRAAISDLNFLLSRGYNPGSALKIVGDNYMLLQRQRLVLMHNACSDQSLKKRKQSEVSLGQIKELTIDGYNFLITLEAAFSGACIFKGREGCYRDLSSLYGNYKKVEETIPAIEKTGQVLFGSGIEVLWIFDAPVSNSGRLASLIREVSNSFGWGWGADTAMNPDKVILDLNKTAVSSDSYILDNCLSWINLPELIIPEIPNRNIIKLY